MSLALSRYGIVVVWFRVGDARQGSMGENEDLRAVMRVLGGGGTFIPSVAVSDSPEGKFSGSSQNKHMEL